MDFGREKDNTMISEKMAAAINDQIKAEFDSAYIYLGMAAYLQDCNLPGMAHWMEKQYHEELEHAERFIEHLYERGARVKIGEIAKPKESYDGPLSVFKESLRHERYVTERIDKLMDQAIEEKDHATSSMLRWFVDEQVEEEANVEAIVRNLEFVGDSHASIYLLDKELGGR